MTSHAVTYIADARRMVEYYRERWTIEQLFRTLKLRGFNAEQRRVPAVDPQCDLMTAALIAAVT